MGLKCSLVLLMVSLSKGERADLEAPEVRSLDGRSALLDHAQFGPQPDRPHDIAAGHEAK